MTNPQNGFRFGTFSRYGPSMRPTPTARRAFSSTSRSVILIVNTHVPLAFLIRQSDPSPSNRPANQAMSTGDG
jgi:hypothetical protein